MPVMFKGDLREGVGLHYFSAVGPALCWCSRAVTPGSLWSEKCQGTEWHSQALRADPIHDLCLISSLTQPIREKPAFDSVAQTWLWQGQWSPPWCDSKRKSWNALSMPTCHHKMSLTVCLSAYVGLILSLIKMPGCSSCSLILCKCKQLEISIFFFLRNASIPCRYALKSNYLDFQICF